MNMCSRVQTDLEQLRTGELLPEEESTVRAHLQECATCAKEAVLLEAFGERISKGLREWVEAGTVPPMLAAQIESSIKLESRAERRRGGAPWLRWRLPLGVAAAAVLLVVVATSVGSELTQQLAAAGGVGGLFQTFLGRSLEDRHGTPEVDPSEPPVVRAVPVNKLAEMLGITVQVDRAEFGADQTKMEYRIRGEGFQLPNGSNLALLEPVLSNAGGRVPFRNLTVQQQGDDYVFQAYFDPVAAGGKWTFRIDQVPRTGDGSAPSSQVAGPWEVEFEDR